MLEKKAGEISLMSLRLKVSALFLIDLSPLVLLNSYGGLLLCVSLEDKSMLNFC